MFIKITLLQYTNHIKKCKFFSIANMHKYLYFKAYTKGLETPVHNNLIEFEKYNNIQCNTAVK